MARKDPIAHLSRHPFELPPRLVEEVLALGEPGIERLLAMAGDRALWTSDEVAASNAFAILGRAREARVVPLAVAALTEAELDGLVYLRASFALEQLGGLIVEPLLAAGLEGERADDATSMLACSGAADPRITARVAELLPRDPEEGCHLALATGDPELVPAVLAAFDRVTAERAIDEDVVDLANGLLQTAEALGGSPGEDRARVLRRMAATAVEMMRQEDDRLADEISELTEMDILLRELTRDEERR